MLLLPGCEVFVIVRFGATSIKSSKSRIFCVLSCSDVTAKTDAGTSCSLSARLLAVTTISSSGELASVDAVCPNATAAQQLSAQTAIEIRRFDPKPIISPGRACTSRFSKLLSPYTTGAIKSLSSHGLSPEAYLLDAVDISTL